MHDRGRVLGDLAVCIADGGRVLSDLATLRDQPELYGPVASNPFGGNRSQQRGWIAAARARVRRGGWAQIIARHGRIPPSWVEYVDLGKTVVIRMDATNQIAHSNKEGAAGTLKSSPY